MVPKIPRNSRRRGITRSEVVIPVVPTDSQGLGLRVVPPIVGNHPSPPRAQGVSGTSSRNRNHPQASPLVARLREDVRQLTRDGGLLDQINKLIGELNKNQADKTITGETMATRPPWHAEAANMIMTIHSGARELENELRLHCGYNPINRGGSENNTRQSLNAIAKLAYAVDKHALKRAAKQIDAWVTGILQISDIDQSEKWVPLPRRPRMAPPPCPYCRTYMLRMLRRAGEVRCFNPACRDNEGHRPHARMEYGQYSGTAYVLFADGTEIRPYGE